MAADGEGVPGPYDKLSDLHVHPCTRIRGSLHAYYMRAEPEAASVQPTLQTTS